MKKYVAVSGWCESGRLRFHGFLDASAVASEVGKTLEYSIAKRMRVGDELVCLVFSLVHVLQPSKKLPLHGKFEIATEIREEDLNDSPSMKKNPQRVTGMISTLARSRSLYAEKIWWEEATKSPPTNEPSSSVAQHLSYFGRSDYDRGGKSE